MPEFNKEDYQKYLALRSVEFNALMGRVMQDPADWTRAKFIAAFALLPKNTKQTQRGRMRGPSIAKREWAMLINHGIIKEEDAPII